MIRKVKKDLGDPIDLVDNYQLAAASFEPEKLENEKCCWDLGVWEEDLNSSFGFDEIKYKHRETNKERTSHVM